MQIREPDKGIKTPEEIEDESLKLEREKRLEKELEDHTGKHIWKLTSSKIIQSRW